MRITKLSKLKDGDTYWHIGVEDKCHWHLYSKCSVYKSNENWKNEIVFESEKSAKFYLKCLQMFANVCEFTED